MPQIRGLFNFKNQLYAVRGDTVYLVSKTGAATEIGTLDSTGGLVSIDQNLTQLQISDGYFLYVWDGTTFQRAPNFVPGGRIAVVNERTVGIQRASQRYSWTSAGNALNQVSTDFKSAESIPDKLVSVLAANSDLWLLGENGSEVHSNVPTASIFERYDGSMIEFGCVSAFAAQKSAGRPTWLATQGTRGEGVVVQAEGMGARVVSNRAVEERLQGKTLSTATSFSFAYGKDEFYVLNVAGVDCSMAYNSTTEQWVDFAELVRGAFRHWRPRCHAFAYGRNYFGDRDGRLYYFDKGVHTIAGDRLCRTRVCPNMGQVEGRRVHYASAQVVCERATAGTVMLRFKDDPQDAWGPWHRVTAGETGKYRSQIRFNQLGSAEGLNGRIFELRMTDDAPFNPTLMEFGVK